MASTRHHTAVRAVLDGLRRRLLDEGLQQHVESLDTLDDGDIVAPTAAADRYPVLRHLGDIVAMSERGSLRDLAAAAAAAAGWTQTRSYVADPPSAEFLDRYAHATLAGSPDGAGSGPTGRGVAVGLLLLGPDVLYPLHRHPADEVYLPLTEAGWAHDADGSFRPESAGTLLHHVPWQPHGTRSTGQPLLAVYLWTGDVATPSEFC